ncbi:MAG TPA: mRNA surveillance protein pelota [archaeon]|nr:mRNA surveillance protein pelota [archaeon]
MKSSFDLKHNIGKITPETPDDLFLLHEIIRPGMIVTARTLRAVEIRRGEEKEKVGKRSVTLTIHIEKTDMTDKLRLGGKIVDGPPEVSRGYHTLEVEAGVFLTIEKPWKAWEIHRIKAARKRVEPILFCILDDSEADFFLVTDSTKHLTNVKGGILKKRTGESKKAEYYSTILELIEKKSQGTAKVVIAGPAFVKEEVFSLIKQRKKELLSNVIVENTYQIGELGLEELLKKGTVEKIVEESQISEEVAVVEEFFTKLVEGGRAVYGEEKVKEGMGSISVLLVSEKKIREYEEIVEEAYRNGLKIRIISNYHAPGEKFLGLAGIGAILY